MSIKDVEHAVDNMRDAIQDLQRIDFDTPREPEQDADAEHWRDFGLMIADKLADAEKAVEAAVRRISS